MQNIVLDFTGCKHLFSIHTILKDSFGFPEWYGKNLDALWDCLYNYCDWELHVSIKGLNTLPQELDEYIKKMFIVFERVQSENPNIMFEVIS